MPDNMFFDMPKEKSSIIKVLGVGGGGSNAVNHMYDKGISGVDFVICNTDAQDLDKSEVPNKVQLGMSVTEGLGAGANPDVGRECAMASIDDVKRELSTGTKMVFITAGMGGGTGTGGAPVIAQCAKEMGLLTVGIVTSPFMWEGRRKIAKAKEGIEQLKEHVDTLLVINNDKLREIFGNLSMREAFSHADDILASAAKGIAEIITVSGYVNVDFKDVETVMKNGGLAVMGSSTASGDDRAQVAIEKALNSPLLDDNHIKGAKNILINISYGDKEVLLDEITEITDYVQDEAGMDVDDIIWGACYNESLQDELSVIVVATGFPKNDMPRTGVLRNTKKEEKRYSLDSEISQNSAPIEEQKRDEPSLFSNEEELSQENEIVFDFSARESEMPNEPSLPKDEVRINDDNRNANISDQRNPNPDLENRELEEIQRMQNAERQNTLKQLSVKLKSPGYLSHIENEPAYKRRNVLLDASEHSSESDMSRFTLGESEEGDKPEIRQNNSFLHDNVD